MNTFLKYRSYLLVIILLLTVGFGYKLSSLKINFSFESFYPRNDPEFKYYSEFQKMFADEQNYVIYIALESPQEDIYDQKFLTDANKIFLI